MHSDLGQYHLGLPCARTANATPHNTKPAPANVHGPTASCRTVAPSNIAIAGVMYAIVDNRYALVLRSSQK